MAGAHLVRARERREIHQRGLIRGGGECVEGDAKRGRDGVDLLDQAWTIGSFRLAEKPALARRTGAGGASRRRAAGGGAGDNPLDAAQLRPRTQIRRKVRIFWSISGMPVR
jgi:hypothetical protein